MGVLGSTDDYFVDRVLAIREENLGRRKEISVPFLFSLKYATMTRFSFFLGVWV